MAIRMLQDYGSNACPRNAVGKCLPLAARCVLDSSILHFPCCDSYSFPDYQRNKETLARVVLASEPNANEKVCQRIRCRKPPSQNKNIKKKPETVECSQC